MEIYLLKSENLSNLGGSMGSEYVTTNYRKPFSSMENAKKHAETEYGKPIGWKDSVTDNLKHSFSGDLAYVSYTIKEGNKNI